MDYEVPSLKDHLDLIQASRKKMVRVSQVFMACEFLSVLAICFVGWSIYIIYLQWAAVFTAFHTFLQVAVGGVAVTLLCVPLLLTLFCEFRRDSLKRDVAISEMRIDIIVGVDTAVREFFGTALPKYSKHLTGFGLAEELLSITNDMSTHNERAHLVTTQALQLLEQSGGIAGIRHEVLKAEYLTKLMSGLLEVLSQHEDVLEASKIDDEIERVVMDFEQHLLAAE